MSTKALKFFSQKFILNDFNERDARSIQCFSLSLTIVRFQWQASIYIASSIHNQNNFLIVNPNIFIDNTNFQMLPSTKYKTILHVFIEKKRQHHLSEQIQINQTIIFFYYYYQKLSRHKIFNIRSHIKQIIATLFFKNIK